MCQAGRFGASLLQEGSWVDEFENLGRKESMTNMSGAQEGKMVTVVEGSRGRLRKVVSSASQV